MVEVVQNKLKTDPSPPPNNPLNSPKNAMKHFENKIHTSFTATLSHNQNKAEVLTISKFLVPDQIPN